MRLDEIRRSFISYFQQKGHEPVASSPLIPRNDPTLLFANAGMNQFKDLFLGKEKRSYIRAASVQKCVRAGGKHNDLENVGFTARHHTFFEMLGNFSFGDYFKEDAIQYAWDFTTQVLKLDRSKIFVTVFHSDDEARKIWTEKAGIAKDRIFGMGEKDNFWQMGDTGPCGPCTELFFDRGESFCKKPASEHFIADGSGCDCDRFTEFWNLVFMQYDRQADGTLNSLPKPSVDTGAGLERLASILQGVDSNYETDHFREIISYAQELLQKPVAPKNQASLRVIADHARAAAFLIADGVLPSNEGRGYVLRRMIRRAVRHGKNLGFERPFLNQVSLKVADMMGSIYPELLAEKTLISKCLFAEEEQFLATIEKGMLLLNQEIEKFTSVRKLSGEVAFKLYDTFGFPLDLTALICKENNASVDEASFDKLMEEQKERSRQHWKGSGESLGADIYFKVAQDLAQASLNSEFIGYSTLKSNSKCLASWSISNPGSGEKLIECVFNQTPFYAESGGQTGDKGTLTGINFRGQVIDTQRPVPTLIVHRVIVSQGELLAGDSCQLEVDTVLRSATTRNHTATHLLNHALRKHLGDHVKQAGSLVTPENLRFDFTHFEGVSAELLQKIEKTVNDLTWKDSAVAKEEMAKEDALKLGAVAMFGEKYGERVRVVSAGPESVEFCGGTHLERTSHIHLFKIIAESSVAAGVRRIVAVTGPAAFDYLNERDLEIRSLRIATNSGSAIEIKEKIERLNQENKDLRKRLQEYEMDTVILKLTEAASSSSSKLKSGSKLVTRIVPPGEFDPKAYRSALERCSTETKDTVFVIVSDSSDEEKVNIIVACSRNIAPLCSAKTILGHLSPLVGGRGGGNDFVAQAGGNLRGKADEIFTTARNL